MMVQLHLFLDEELFRAVRRIAGEEGETVSTVARRALRLYVGGHRARSHGPVVPAGRADGRTDGRTDGRENESGNGPHASFGRRRRSTMKEEYRQGQVAWTPSCGDFTSSGGSANFTWSELNGGFTNGNPHSPWGIVKGVLTDGLEDTRTNYSRGGIRLSSGYRCPHGNANVGGAQQSRHMFGDAADMYSADHPWTEQEFDLLRAAALLTGPTELLNWNSYPDHHLHAAW